MNIRTQHMPGSQARPAPHGNAIAEPAVEPGRPFGRADYLALKAATRRACEAAGSLADISKHTRVDPALLSRYGNPERVEFAPLDIAMDLDALAGADQLLRTWAGLRGYELVSRTVETICTARLAEHIPAIAKELSDVVSALAQTKIDTPAAAARVETEIAEARDALNDADRDCRRVRAGGA